MTNTETLSGIDLGRTFEIAHVIADRFSEDLVRRVEVELGAQMLAVSPAAKRKIRLPPGKAPKQSRLADPYTFRAGSVAERVITRLRKGPAKPQDWAREGLSQRQVRQAVNWIERKTGVQFTRTTEGRATIYAMPEHLMIEQEAQA